MIGSILLFVLINHSTIKEVGASGLEITFVWEGFDKQDISFSEAVWLANFGEPNLPSVVYTIGIPQEGSVDVRVAEHKEELIEDIIIDPVIPLAIYEPPVPEKVELQGDVYNKNMLFPKDLFEIKKPGYFRDIYTVDIQLNPARYNPVLKRLLISKKVRLQVKFKGKPVARPITNRSFERIYERTILNYKQCKAWRREPKPNRKNPFGPGVWFKIEVPEQGLYRIGYDEIKKAGLNPKQFDPKTMKVYTSGYDLLPLDIATPFVDSLIEIPVYVEGEKDHQFDKDDYLVFFGYGASHFQRDTGITWFENGYARNNVYWFTFGGSYGQRMDTIHAKWHGDNPDTIVKEILHYEKDIGNPTRSGINWYWKDISPGAGPLGKTTLTLRHPRALGRADATLAIFTLDAAGPFQYKFLFNEEVFFAETLSVPKHDCWPPYYLRGNGTIIGDSSTLTIEIARLAGNTKKLTAFLNSLRLEYDRQTDLTQPFCAFFKTATNYSIKCTNVPSKPFILDITDLRRPKMLVSFSSQGNTIYLSASTDSSQILYFTRLDSAKSAQLIPAKPGSLRNQDIGAEYLFITHKNFYNALRPLVIYRQQEYTTKVVTIDQIFDDFSFGKYDPLAIKHFLYFTTNNWLTVPQYVLLVGDATYDFKNNLGKENPPNYIPLYESETKLYGNPGIPENTIYEGEYVNFFGREDMILGRITVRNNQEVRDFIDKLITYETADIDGIWNKRIILAGDDEYGTTPDPPEGVIHCRACESIAGLVPDSLYDFLKIYMLSYPPFMVGIKKPHAQEDFIRILNRSGLAGAFFGHGNTHQLAHEGLFYDTEVPRIKNGRRYFFFYFASCTVARFNDSDYECIAEELVRIKEGAIGTMGATRGTSRRGNELIGDTLFKLITDPNIDLTMGECVNLAKRQGSREYLLIGDPATKFRKIKEEILLSATPDSLRPLEILKVSSSKKPYYLNVFIRDTSHIDRIDTNTVNKISGYVFRIVAGTPFAYKIDGREVYAGYWDNDTAQIIIPRLPTTAHLPVVKLSGFKDQASGMLDSIRVYGSAIPSQDIAGPEVAFYDGPRRLNDSAWVDKEFMLTGKISDQSGINLLNSKEDARGFYLYLNQNLAERVDLRDYFSYDQNSCTSGRFHTPITMEKAVSTITVNVTDNNYNQTVKKLVLKTEFHDRIAIENFLIYPNPVRDTNGLWFTFYLTGAGKVDIKIFTIAGRLIKTIRDRPGQAGYNQIFWDGLDEYKDELANGVYLVQAIVESETNSDQIIEQFIIAR